MFSSYSEKICRVPRQRHGFQVQPEAKSSSCDMCDKKNWLSETDVELHKKKMHFNAIHKQLRENVDRFCTICMKLQPSEFDLILHIKTRHLYSAPNAKRIEREIFICDHCNHIFFNKDMLLIHIMNLHKNKKGAKTLVTCPICKRIIKLKYIWFHFYLHDIPSVTGCDICLAYFNTSDQLMEHTKTHPRHYFCDICSYHTTKEGHFDIHLHKHSQTVYKDAQVSANIYKAPCEDKKRYRKYNIHHALKGLYMPKFMNICIICREICTSPKEAHTHMVRDHVTSPRDTRAAYVCACARHFFNRVLLKQHVFKEKGRHRELAENETPSIFFDNNVELTVEIQGSRLSEIETQTDTHIEVIDKPTDKQTERSKSNKIIVISDEVINDTEKVLQNREMVNDKVILLRKADGMGEEIVTSNDKGTMKRKREEIINDNDKVTIKRMGKEIVTANDKNIIKSKVEGEDIIDSNDEVIMNRSDKEIIDENDKEIIDSNDKEIIDENDKEIIDSNDKEIIDSNDEVIDIDNEETISTTDKQNDSVMEYVFLIGDDVDENNDDGMEVCEDV